MRKISISVMLVFQFLNTNSFAQDTSAGAATATNTSGTGAFIESASTTKIRAPKTEFNPYSVSAYFLGGYSDQQFYNENPSFGIFDSYVSFNYQANPDVRLSARPAFGYATAGIDAKGKNVTDKAYNRDFSFAASIKNIGEDFLPEDIKLKFKPRLYLPTSDGSQEQGMIAKFRFEWEIKYYVSRYNNFRIYLVPNYYFQKNTVYLRPAIGASKAELKSTTMVDSEHGIEYTQELNKIFGLKPSIGFKEVWSNTSNVNTDREKVQYRQSSWYYGGGLEVNPSRDWGFTVGVRTEKDLINTDRSEETSYTILADAVIF